MMTLLTRRPTSMRRHPGQIAFPGGALDRGDLSPVDTASREALEEVNPSGEWRAVAMMSPLKALTSDFNVVPVVFACADPHPTFAPSSSEVEAMGELELPRLEDFKLDNALGPTFRVPGLGLVFGLTALVLLSLIMQREAIQWPF